jgi:methylmalonyl-CoA/ethylmalonyl-CoA epimerase
MREIWRTPENEHPDMADLVLEIPGQETFWEIIQPVGEESFIERFLERRGPSIHHVTFQVSDWDRAVSACEQHKAPLFDENSGVTDGARWRDAFIHPRHTGGMLVQLFWEESPGVWIRSDKTRPPGWKQ